MSHIDLEKDPVHSNMNVSRFLAALSSHLSPGAKWKVMYGIGYSMSYTEVRQLIGHLIRHRRGRIRFMKNMSVDVPDVIMKNEYRVLTQLRHINSNKPLEIQLHRFLRKLMMEKKNEE